ncbi:MAG TPA: endonuclease/exonuclease/phosphatase family protein [Candidatus Paceibacterota bacterium]
MTVIENDARLLTNMLKLISLNIELNKHFERNIPFLKNESADVLCLQEVFESDISYLQQVLGYPHVLFAPMSQIAYALPSDERIRENHYSIADGVATGSINSDEYIMGNTGIAILSKTPLSNSETFYYLPLFENELHIHNSHGRGTTEGRVVIHADVEVDAKKFTIATTHFTWTPKGEPDEAQRTDLVTMMNHLKKLDEYIFCGDFNAPRGGEIFSQLSQKLHDNIPLEVTSTLDPTYHTAKGIEVVVDGLFTTPNYKVRQVALVEEVSDHKAIVAIIDTM